MAHKFALKYPTLDRFSGDYEGRFLTGGIPLKTNKDINLGDDVEMRFRIPSDAIELVASGTIAWIDDAVQPETGKRRFLVRNIVLSEESQRLIRKMTGAASDDVAGTEEVSEVDFESMAQTPVPTPKKKATKAKKVATKEENASGGKKALVVVLLIFVLLSGGVGVWLFQFDGLMIVLSRFGTPPARVQSPALQLVQWKPEPAWTAPAAPAPKPAPKPKKVIPQVRITEFEQIQGETYNRFTIIGSDTIASVSGVAKSSPPRYVLTIKNAKSAVSKPQYFLPFTYIRTVQFDQVGRDVQVTFLATQSYLPRVQYETDGSAVDIIFLADE